PIPEGPAVRFFAPYNGARNADKLGAHLIGRQLDLRVSVTARVNELEMRRKLRVRERTCALQVEAFRIFKARADTMPQQHVIRPLGLTAIRPVSEEQGAQGMIFA